MADESKKPARKVEVSIELDAPLEAVWKALTDLEAFEARWQGQVRRLFPEGEPPTVATA